MFVNIKKNFPKTSIYSRINRMELLSGPSGVVAVIRALLLYDNF